MKNSTSLILVLCMMLLCPALPSRAETLGEILESAELGALIGTWVDEDSNGEALSLTYTWRIENHVLGLSVKMADDNAEAMIAVNPENGEVVHVTANDKGGMGMGKWADENGVATLTLTTVSADKQETTVKITHQIVDNKQLVVGLENVETGEGGEMTLVRKSE